MELNIVGLNIELTQPIRDHVQARLTAALNQHATRVRRVEVTLEDVNGPRGGEDQVCKIAVELTDGSTLHHERRGMDLYENVSLIADTVKQRVGKEADRLKRPHR